MKASLTWITLTLIATFMATPVDLMILPLAAISYAFWSNALYILVGVLPCVLWLMFYLAQDKNPEPKKEILAVFFLGALATVPAVCVEIFMLGLFQQSELPAAAILALSYIVGVGFVEEFFKYATVWLKEQAINRNKQLDEPVDLVIYMIVAALGFAAAENIFLLLPASLDLVSVAVTLRNSLFRAISAILLHTLCSGILGCFMAGAFCQGKHRRLLLLSGIVIASALHGFYDLFIIGSEANPALLFGVLGLILAMAIGLFAGFRKVKSMKSVCNLNI